MAFLKVAYEVSGLFCLYKFGEFIEQVGVIFWAGAGFGMVLNRENRTLCMAQTLNGIVVQVEVGYLYAFGQGFGAQGIAMILAGDVNLAGR